MKVPDSETKKTYCNEIAKFYIKIAHVFSAIVTTINPEYVYKDVFGNTVKKNLMQKSSIPSGVATQVSKINLCGERINALKGKQKETEDKADVGKKDQYLEEDIEIKENEQTGDYEYNYGETIEIQPNICSVNLDKNGETNYLNDEPGIDELIDLYFDGDYDLKTGKFMGMTTETEKHFQDDLKRFYMAFTDNAEMPPDIKKFSDIKLRDYSSKKFCESGKNNKAVKGGYKDELFLKYADNLKAMIQSVNVKQDALLTIINKIFVYVLDPVTDKEVIRINPDLTESGLQELIVKTRNLIIELYLKCETDFVEGVKIYEAIVESQIFNTTQKHIDQLEKERGKLITPYTQIKA
jgi:hypothetical protein